MTSPLPGAQRWLPAALLLFPLACKGPETPQTTAPAAEPAAAAESMPGSILATAKPEAPASSPAGTTARPEPAVAPKSTTQATGEAPPVPGVEPVDHLIHPDERHFAQLWKVTSGGENAEAYWNFAGDRLVLQRRNVEERILCDRIYATHPTTGKLEQLSDGRGATTCAYFLPGDKQVLFASTGGVHEECPPPPDLAQGYVWALHPEHDIYVKDLETGAVKALTETWGYDAEATISPKGDRIVFTSTRSGDLELWTCDLAGGDLRQVTDRPGYDGGAFFSHDGTKLVFRATVFDPAKEAEQIADYRRLLADWKVRPAAMEIFVCDVDGSNRRQITNLGQANWAPYFTPDDQRILFTSNHHVGARSRNFDIFSVDLEGKDLQTVTRFEGFDSFPMFSPDGRYVAFGSNRGGTQTGETNVYIARWRD